MPRPKKHIDPAQVEKLAALCATHEEMADILGCDRATLERRFAAEIRKGRASVKAKLRRLQLRAAENGNAAMLIFLGKTLLGQSEKPNEKDPVIIEVNVTTREEDSRQPPI